ncbi:WSCD2 [Branchiostoma lanceolatum]|uniref:WSCD2 protein n=1 Tax=Branchiostoma lanceolatum TaxID=7740 RepID=A0A8K0A464_BRALA|nr:WSCD2 [Branchiostoma lanceolatum]
MKVYTCTLLVVVLMAVAKESLAAEYKGCYVKNYGDPYFPYSLVDRKMSNDMCVQHCKEQGKAYAATKSVRCGCGTEEHVAEMTKAADSECSNNCKAGGGTCGGYARLSVYSTA